MEQLQKELSFLKFKFTTFNSWVKLGLLIPIWVISVIILIMFSFSFLVRGRTEELPIIARVSGFAVGLIFTMLTTSFILSRVFFITANTRNKENNNTNINMIANLYKTALFLSLNIYRYRKLKKIKLNEEKVTNLFTNNLIG